MPHSDGNFTDAAEPGAPSSEPVVTILRCKDTGRTLAIDVSPADGSLQVLVDVLSTGWPLSAHIAPLPASATDSTASGG